MTLAQASDLELLHKVRSGDDSAVSALLGRHGHVMSRLGRGYDDSVSHDVVRDCAANALDSGLPFRAVLLGQAVLGDAPDGSLSPDRTVWRAFTTLPTAWRLAVWHREVEGQKPARIGEFLGMTEREATRALCAAYAALKRSVAGGGHRRFGETDECHRLSDIYRFTPPVFMDRSHTRDLREHGRHCDPCMPLIRDLFTVDHDLRGVLAEIVMGAAASDYLARRPKPSRIRLAAATSDSLSGRALMRPAAITLSVGAVAAAAVAMVVVNPHRAVEPLLSGRTAAQGSIAAGTTFKVVSAPVAPVVSTTTVALSDTVPARTPNHAATQTGMTLVHTGGHHHSTPTGAGGTGTGSTSSGTGDSSPVSVPGAPSGTTPVSSQPGTPAVNPPTTPTTPDNPSSPVTVHQGSGGTTVTVTPPVANTPPVTVTVPPVVPTIPVAVPPVTVSVPPVVPPVTVPPVSVPVPPVSVPGVPPIGGHRL